MKNKVCPERKKALGSKLGKKKKKKAILPPQEMRPLFTSTPKPQLPATPKSPRLFSSLQAEEICESPDREESQSILTRPKDAQKVFFN